METILMIKRLPVTEKEFEGDKTWQVAPYQITDKAHAERLLAWLQKTVLKNVPHDHKIVCA